MSLLRIAAAFVTVMPVLIGNDEPVNSSLIAHEWGTFTSVAATDGTPVEWAPLTGAPDLPCFVNRLSPRNLKLAPGLVRMETPVLYFYSPGTVTLSVHVKFPQGWITEWYPQASGVKPEFSSNARVRLESLAQGEITWNSIQVLPGTNAQLPSTEGGSRYFAARQTDSAPLQIGDEQEKFIFYRGLGNFAVPLDAKFVSDEKLELRNTGSEPIPLAIMFEKSGDKIGYRIVQNVEGSVELDVPELTGALEDLQQQIRSSLVEFGLYQKEAAAMVETWRDSWFEEGTRVFYIVPRTMVDSVLPLEVDPAPSMMTRVFVGRVEILSPAVRQSLETALSIGDIETLAKFGRFLNPFLSQLSPEHVQSPAADEYLQRAYTKIDQEFYSASCIQ